MGRKRKEYGEATVKRNNLFPRTEERGFRRKGLECPGKT
jgi:hypothetical protein